MSGRFEKEFAELHECRFGVVSNSGTSSLVVALQALRELNSWQDGDEVLVPSVTFVASVNAVIHCGLRPVLVDVTDYSYDIDVELMENALTDRTVAIMPVHPFGLPADMGYIARFASDHDLKVIEDSCECMNVSVEEKSVGSWGDVGCFSTYVAHIMVTGVGGMATTNDDALARKMRSLVNHGIETDSLPSADGYDPSHLSRKFRFTSIGHSFRITELEAALGLSQMEDLDSTIEARQENGIYLEHSLMKLDRLGLLRLQRTSFMTGSEHSYMVFPLVLEIHNKNVMMSHLRNNGIECRDLLPLTNQPCYSDMFNPDDYPVAKFLNGHGLYIPCHQHLAPEDLDKMVNSIYEFFGENRV
jgi:CDP-6-deoxy-D-xylo-4-hexulose-3-dehydrase